MVWTYTRGLAGVQDILFGDSTTTQNQSRKGLTGTNTRAIQYIDDAVIPLSSATKTLLSLVGTQYIDDGFSAVASGAGIQYASTSQNGQVYRMSEEPASASQPIAMEQNDARVGYIPSSTQKTSLNAETPDTRNDQKAHTRYVSKEYLDENAWIFGTGKDGAYTIGAVTDPAVAPSGLSTSTSGGYIPAGTYSYKVTFGNITGETLPSSASSTQVTTGATSTITLTIPAGGNNTAWRKVYRDDGGGTWRLVAYIANNTVTSITDDMPVGGAAAPGSNTTAASWSNPSGEWHFDGDTTIGALTVATSGNMAGVLIIRVRGYVTINGAISANGAFANSSGPGFGFSGYLSGSASGSTGNNGVDAPYATYALLSGTVSGYGANQATAHIFTQGKGGTGGTGGTAGVAGGTVIICAYGITVDTGGSVTANGGDGGDATAGADRSGGGGGAGGLVALVGRKFVWTKATTSCTATGGAGGDSRGSGGANYVGGAGGGGGGYVYYIAPVFRIDGSSTITAGSGGAAGGTATTTARGASGGAYAGSGGAGGNGNATGSSGSVGQAITASTATGYRKFPALGGVA